MFIATLIAEERLARGDISAAEDALGGVARAANGSRRGAPATSCSAAPGRGARPRWKG